VRRVDLLIKPYGLAQFPVTELLVLHHGFSTVPSGNMSETFAGRKSEAIANRTRFMGLFDCSLQATAIMVPDHTDKIKLVDARDMGASVKCDALITSQHGVGLALLPADCYPVIITGSDSQRRSCLSLVHSGPKGTRLGIVAKTIQKMEELGVMTSSMRIAIGPGIGPCCYNRTDLVSEIVVQAIEQGILESSIIAANCCTYCSKDSRGKPLFFSHSRSTREQEREGRFMAFVSL